MIGRLILEDGSVFYGKGFGYNSSVVGEVVFNTSMTGYQEILTDPSYYYQIVCMTYPMIGNYGVNDEDIESDSPKVSGFLVKEFSKTYSNYRANSSLDEYLKKHKIPALEGLDTRALTRKLRNFGSMLGIISFDSKKSNEELLKELKKSPSMKGLELASKVSTKTIKEFKPEGEKKYKVIAYDYGIKYNIIRHFNNRGVYVKLVPYDTPAEEVLKEESDGIFLSNGPGDPSVVKIGIENAKKIIGKKPVFGICLGHQIIGLALGAKTYKLKFGHRGGNQPIKDIENGNIIIAAENHGFAVMPDSLPKEVKKTHINLNDNTLEGIEWKEKMLLSVQFHPESSPGPNDANYLFDKFIEIMEKRSK
ncbi:MAG TPA: glutamine-hydrolyzing carbamoyl-phosphate synthase small subunit [Spirochaetota bacterium]|nr:glutamine-hydrolyzing carbamoyl-phosphate synthase small subunit [Spirochaetota bacterium]HOM38236.1 glutamine-hydrolyzing carbamoyl-phosphate synthase small subunit [Spirochaetota bacterium]HPQ48546.1 glutamine-hydrolyzing carbamoyl-phosphate synthase small subunit [Spirochaetota bacterium]